MAEVEKSYLKMEWSKFYTGTIAWIFYGVILVVEGQHRCFKLVTLVKCELKKLTAQRCSVPPLVTQLGNKGESSKYLTHTPECGVLVLHGLAVSMESEHFDIG